jgi:hypothetical protein
MTSPRDRLKRLLAAGLEGDPTSQPGPADWQAPPPAALEGVFPRLQPLELLGQGGMGAVYKARQPHLDRLVALKVLSPRLAADPSFAERFTREALVLARLSHPHIVTLHDVGEAGGWRYLVMEYVPGATLRQVLRTGAFSAREALALVPQLCDALDYAHAQGVVHRDLKPENILLDDRGQARIADFGLAKLGGAGDPGITRTGQVLGTAAYMAPEQMAGTGEVDHRADLFALGVVIYEMLTGELPVGRFAPPSRRVQVDVRLDEVVLRALERTPEQRWQSAGEVRRAFGAAAGGASGRSLRWRTVALLCVFTALIGAGASLAVARHGDRDPAGRGVVVAPIPPVPPQVVEPAPAPVPAPPVAAPAVVLATVAAVVPPPATAPVAMVEPAVPATVATVVPSPVPAPAAVQPAPVTASAATAPAAKVETAPVAVVGARQRLALEGTGSLEIHQADDAPPLQQLPSRGLDGASVVVGADGGMRLRVSSFRTVRLTVPPDALAQVDATGTGEVRLHGCSGAGLLIRQLGSGRVTGDGLRFERLELRQQGIGAAQLAGRAGTLVVDLDQGANADATRLRATRIEAVVRGIGCLRLAGKVAHLRLRLSGGGRVEADGLDADAADVTITGIGNAVLGTLGALDATCTGGGSLRYAGNPRLGRIITRDQP